MEVRECSLAGVDVKIIFQRTRERNFFVHRMYDNYWLFARFNYY